MSDGAGQAIIICATQRTGSGMVIDDLRNLAGYPPGGSELLYKRILDQSPGTSWADCWNTLRSECAVQGRFVDKVMFHYVPRISGFIAGLEIKKTAIESRFSPEKFDAFRTFFRDALWVHLEREDVCAQAVSMHLAVSTDIWARWSHRAAPPQKHRLVEYDFQKIKIHYDKFMVERKEWLRFFSYYCIAPISIRYEDAIGQYPHYLMDLFGQAGLVMVAKPQARRVLKTGDAVNDAFLARFRADLFSLGAAP